MGSLSYQSVKEQLRLRTTGLLTRDKLQARLDLLGHLVWRDFTLRYKRSVLGILWSLVLPIVQLLVFVLVFQVVVPLNIEAYPLYVFSALLPWAWFSNSVSSSTTVFIGNRDLMRHPNLRPYTLVIVNTLSNMISYLTALPVLAVLLIIYHHPAQTSMLLIPLLWIMQLALTVGISLIVATLNIFYRDVQHLTGIIVGLLFYITPVFYRAQQATQGGAARVLALNPMKWLVEGYRDLMYGQIPDLRGMLYTAVVSVVVCVVGALIYVKQQHKIFDNL